ncbi:hypothetical protein DPMN_044371 [Dreissena polymorpha]|uniref:Uncharacterized protein n=1 Tax=Dreissena polymorpha TaxID=45954 RepID=A0A9D4D2U4_DREPO|nr:hypothetical protein DPMN_044371 [Dreissena polymorpha]
MDVLANSIAILHKYIDYLLTLCSNDNLRVFVKSSPVKCYIASCVRLTLLMTAHDPPVVIVCPGWQPFLKRPYEERKPDVSTKEHDSTAGLCESTATDNKDDSDCSRNNNSFQEELKPNSPDGITNGKNHEAESGESHIKSGDYTSNTKTFTQEGNIVEIPNVLPSAEMKICAKNDTVNKLADSSENKVESKNNGLKNMECMKMSHEQQNVKNTSLRLADVECIDPSLFEGIFAILSGSETSTAHDNEMSTVAFEHVQSDNGFGTTLNSIEFVNQPSGIKQEENTTKSEKIAHERAKESKTNENAGKIQVTKERPDFDTEKFKEYTSRGPFADYFVWPLMYLHQDGPMLGKGIAQGCKKKMDNVSRKPFVWWKRMPMSQM